MMPAITIEEFGLFSDFIYSHAGIRMTEKKMPLIQNRLRKRLRELGLNSYRAYYSYLRQAGNEAEVQECLDALTTNETYFFRHKMHWDFIHSILPAWYENAKKENHRPFRVWSAAASTGEEAYSAAIILDDFMGRKPEFTYQVDGTDINGEVLNRAKSGVYSPYAVQKLTEKGLTRYFRHDPAQNLYHIKDDLKQHVSFTSHNLLSAKFGAKYDLVFLRNVMIYFDDDSKKTVLSNTANCLRKGGHLILGGAETLTVFRDSFTYVQPTIFRKN